MATLLFKTQTSSNLSRVKEIHLIGPRGELKGVESSTATSKGTPHRHRSFIYVLRILRALTEKIQRKKVKNYTFTVEEIVCFHL